MRRIYKHVRRYDGSKRKSNRQAKREKVQTLFEDEKTNLRYVCVHWSAVFDGWVRTKVVVVVVRRETSNANAMLRVRV